MSQISVNNLTFHYDTSYDNIFDNVSFDIDTDWKLGFIGRNGRGKTTFLNLLLNKFKYSGTISHTVDFDYFPFIIENKSQNTLETVKNIIAPFSLWEAEMETLLNQNTADTLQKYGDTFEKYNLCEGYIINELIVKESNELGIDEKVFKRPFDTLSNGERTKLMLVSLFLKKNNFLLIDEPTNHLDIEGRKIVSDYLFSKKGFILVSHDRQFLDNIVDHVLSINKSKIEIQKGNFSSWYYNKQLEDTFELEKNTKLKKEIKRLEVTAKEKSNWSDKVEATKIGTHQGDRGRIGHLVAKMMKRSKAIEVRVNRSIEEKSKLLKNIEISDSLKISSEQYHQKKMIELKGVALFYGEKKVCSDLSFILEQGDRLALCGKNGSGKSSIIKLICGEKLAYKGNLYKGSNLKISYVSQETSFLKGDLKEFAHQEDIDESLFKAILRKLDFTRVQFEKDMSQFSSGQKKKVLIARSLSKPAHLYIWDEPLNFIDVLSRIQIEDLILKYCPTMIFVEHDSMFNKNVATKIISLN